MNTKDLPPIDIKVQNALFELIKQWPLTGTCPGCQNFSENNRYCQHFKAQVPMDFLESGKTCNFFKLKVTEQPPNVTLHSKTIDFGLDDDIPF